MAGEMDNPWDLAREAAEVLSAWAEAPRVIIVLGSGLGGYAERLVDTRRLSYNDIPHFPSPGVSGHAGKLMLGRAGANGPTVAALSGRAHLYEGHGASTVVHATRAMALWGARILVITNAAGSTHDGLAPGDLMSLTDHLNFTGKNPLVGPEEPSKGSRFIDMTNPYDPAVRALLQQSAEATGTTLHEGVYAGLLGPSYETAAEVQAMYRLGADAVGMSTVLEVIAARHAGVRVAAISCITNYGTGVSQQTLSHAEVHETASKHGERFMALLDDALPKLHEEAGERR